MNDEIAAEFYRLRRNWEQAGLKWHSSPGASANSNAQVEKDTGVLFDDDLRSLWRITNGSNDQHWFVSADCNFLDPNTTYFLSIEQAKEAWDFYAPYDDEVYREWQYDGSCGDRDSRLQPVYLRHRLWFPIAERYGGDPLIQFDADPTDLGQYGQIVEYLHDPDVISYVAPSFLHFFRRSNDYFENWLHERPEELVMAIQL